MTVRIDLYEDPSATRVKVAGWLDGPVAQELRELCRDRPGPHIDLGDLVSADRAALGILRELRDRGARLTGASAFITLLLEEEAGESPTPETRSKKEE